MEMPGEEGLREASVMQLTMTYIGRQQATVAQWVALRLLSEVCEREKGYGGVELRREAWWLQETTEKKLWATLVGISWEAKRRRRFGEIIMQ